MRAAALPLGLAVAGGLLVAVVLGRVLDDAVTDWAERDLARSVERVGSELEPLLADSAALASRVRLLANRFGARVTVIAPDGRVLADSDVAPDRLANVESHAERPEIRAAGRDGVGTDRRRSATLGELLVYTARRLGPAEAPTGFARLAVRHLDLESAEAPFRAKLTRLAVAAGCLVALVLVAARLRHARETALLEEAIGNAAAGERPASREGVSEEAAGVFRALSRFADLVRHERQGSARRDALARAVFEGVPVGLLVVDRDLRLLDANRALASLFDAPEAASLAGRHVVEAIRSSELVSAFTRALRGERVELETFRVERAVGRERVVELSVWPFPTGAPEGAPAAVGVVRDVTERERSEDLRRRFVADVSHELRTPVASVRAAAETLAGEETLPEPLRPLAAILTRQGKAMEELIADLLDLSQIEAGLVELSVAREPLRPLLLEVVEDLAEAARRKRIEVAVGVPEALAVWGDARRLAQVFRNLLDNAVKFSPEGSSVRVDAAAAGGGVRVTVADRGIGIPRGEEENVFQRFYRVDRSRAKTTPGTGLGLSIVKHLVLLHGGTVGVESTPGAGSRFTVTLPAEPRERAPSA